MLHLLERFSQLSTFNCNKIADDNASPLTSGTTYKVTLSGSAKDSDGNTLGSDVVKYITP